MSKRKYRMGDRIGSLDELAKQEFIYFNRKIYHQGWVFSWQFRMILQILNGGGLYYAVPMEEENI